MNATLLKVLHAVLAGIGAAIYAYIQTNPNAPSGVNPLVWGLIVAALVRLSGWAVSKAPASNV